MVDPAPGHVGDVQQTIDAAEVDEATVVSDVLDDTIENHALFDTLEGLLFQVLPLSLKKGPTGKDDIPPALVELDNFELEALANEFVEIAHWAQVDL